MKNEENKGQVIARHIKIAREKAGFSQLDLAKLLGFESATAVSLIENGERRVSAENLALLAEKLHRTIPFFLGEEDKPVDVKVALRADKDISDKDKDAILRFIEIAKRKHG